MIATLDKKKTQCEKTISVGETFFAVKFDN